MSNLLPLLRQRDSLRECARYARPGSGWSATVKGLLVGTEHEINAVIRSSWPEGKTAVLREAEREYWMKMHPYCSGC